MTQIREALKQLAEPTPVQVLVGTVQSVDWNKRTCKVETEDKRTFFKVRLRAVMDNSTKGICLKPKVNTYVLIGLINNKQQSAYLVSCTEVDAIEIITNSDVLKLDVANGTFELNGGSNDGVVKINPLVQKMNELESYVKALATQFNTHTHPTPTGTSSAPTAPFTNQLQGTQKSDLENTKVKH